MRNEYINRIFHNSFSGPVGGNGTAMINNDWRVTNFLKHLLNDQWMDSKCAHNELESKCVTCNTYNFMEE